MNDEQFRKTIEEHQNQEVSGATQEMLNKPLHKTMDPVLETYMFMVKDLLESKQIDPYVPSSLIKSEVFDPLTEQEQALVELSCANLCGILRQAQALWSREEAHSYQMELLIQNIFQTKERLENQVGDVLYL